MTAVLRKSPDAALEWFDDEVVAVNLRSGTYFSLDDVAGVLFEALDGRSITEAVDHVSSMLVGDREELARTVEAFSAVLLEAGLLEQASAVGDQAAAASGFAADRPAIPLRAPGFESFDDMQDLLLLDPVHDSHDAGWPRAAGA